MKDHEHEFVSPDPFFTTCTVVAMKHYDAQWYSVVALLPAFENFDERVFSPNSLRRKTAIYS
jgi:hypothetical protein